METFRRGANGKRLFATEFEQEQIAGLGEGDETVAVKPGAQYLAAGDSALGAPLGRGREDRGRRE